MNDITIILLIVTGLSPICYMLLRLIFGNSIMFQVAFWTVFYTIFSSVSYFIAGVIGIKNLYWIGPIVFLIGLVVYLYINKLLRKPLANNINYVKQLSEGQLDFGLKKLETESEMGVLNNSILQLVLNLSNIVNEIKDSSDNLSDSSNSLTKVSEQILQGANEQAASVEEISATMEEMTANIEANTANAFESEKLAKAVSHGITEVKSAAKLSIDSVHEIERKIDFINELAMQTNILSLNASVEAARAGVYGKGFAVVASEVKRLAERSRSEAVEIGKLAKNSVVLTESSGRLMSELIPFIEKSTQLALEISAASIEQNKGASQINGAIQQLNGIAQQNASAADQMANRAIQLSKKAAELKELILYFKLHH